MCGGAEVCEDMVGQDVLTPLAALLNEVRRHFFFFKQKRENKIFFGDPARTDGTNSLCSHAP